MPARIHPDRVLTPSEKQARYHEKHPNSRRLNKRRYLLKKHGLTESDFLRLSELGCCICNAMPDPDAPDPRNRVLHCDHCHIEGGFRGLLCNQCNRGLGMFKDCPSLLRRARDYLMSDLTST